MVIYAFTALQSTGKKRRGIVDAENEREAKDKLREKGLMVCTLRHQQKTGKQNELSGDALLNFTVQLSLLVKSGVPIFQSLLALEEQCREEKYHRIIANLCEQIKRGKSLSAAMAQHPASFSPLYCSMVAAGESAGALDSVLEKLSILLNKSMRLRKQMTTALIYPAVLASFCLAVVFILLTFVIPSIKNLFADRPVNAFTLLVFNISDFLTGYWYLYLPLLAAAVLLFSAYCRSAKGREMRDHFSLKIPLISVVVKEAALARFTRTLTTLLQGGLNMIDSMRLARKVLLNSTLEEIIAQAENKIIEGSSLSQELKKSPLIPKMVVHMLAVGEESGNLTPMLQHIAALYEDELEKNLTRLTALVQPAILLLMGGIVGIIMCAILLPLTDVNAFF